MMKFILTSLTVGLTVFLCPSLATAQAIDHLDEQLQIRQNRYTEDSTEAEIRSQADKLLEAATKANQNQDYAQGVQLLRAALEGYERIQDDGSLAEVAEYLGVTYAKLGQYHEAEFYFRRSLAIFRDLNQYQQEIKALNNLGTLLLYNQNPRGAQAAFEDAFAVAQSIGSQEGMGLSLSNLGLVSVTQENYAQGIQFYRDALVFRRRFNDPVGQANTLNNIGDAYQAWGKHDLALAEYRLARWYAREGDDLENHFRALQGLAVSYVKEGLLSPAFQALDRWITLARDTDNLTQELAGLHLYAKYYAALGDRTQALALYDNAIAVAQTLEDSQSEAILRNELTQILYNYPFGLPPNINN